MRRVLNIWVLLFFTVFGTTAAEAQEQTGLRITPAEIEAIPAMEAGTGTSGVSGIRTRVLKGDPNKPGIYTIQLFIPANTQIAAHSHPDDRVATVISGTWNIGFGSVFDSKKLKALVPGSFYTEPPESPHFAMTGDKPVILQITGYGPSGLKPAMAEEKANQPKEGGNPKNE